jgi:hypothetical protein
VDDAASSMALVNSAFLLVSWGLMMAVRALNKDVEVL